MPQGQSEIDDLLDSSSGSSEIDDLLGPIPTAAKGVGMGDVHAAEVSDKTKIAAKAPGFVQKPQPIAHGSIIDDLLESAGLQTQPAVQPQPVSVMANTPAAPKINDDTTGLLTRQRIGPQPTEAQRSANVKDIMTPKLPANAAPVPMPSQGLLEKGNLDPFNRPVLQNSDGTQSTAVTKSFNIDGKEVLIPTVVNGQKLDDAQAIQNYIKTGQHFGKFDTPDNANAYAQALHQNMANQGQNKQAEAGALTNLRRSGVSTPPAEQPMDPMAARVQDLIKAHPLLQIIADETPLGIIAQMKPGDKGILDPLKNMVLDNINMAAPIMKMHTTALDPYVSAASDVFGGLTSPESLGILAGLAAGGAAVGAVSPLVGSALTTGTGIGFGAQQLGVASQSNQKKIELRNQAVKARAFGNADLADQYDQQANYYAAHTYLNAGMALLGIYHGVQGITDTITGGTSEAPFDPTGTQFNNRGGPRKSPPSPNFGQPVSEGGQAYGPKGFNFPPDATVRDSEFVPGAEEQANSAGQSQANSARSKGPTPQMDPEEAQEAALSFHAFIRKVYGKRAEIFTNRPMSEVVRQAIKDYPAEFSDWIEEYSADRDARMAKAKAETEAQAGTAVTRQGGAGEAEDRGPGVPKTTPLAIPATTPAAPPQSQAVSHAESAAKDRGQEVKKETIRPDGTIEREYGPTSTPAEAPKPENETALQARPTVDEAKSQRIADFYQKADSTPNDPEVQQAYQKFNDETHTQYQKLVDDGYAFEPTDNQGPYNNVDDMRADLANKHLKVWTGGTPQHGLMTPEQNFEFRAVHDAVGHGPQDNTFGHAGEEGAYATHKEMYSPEAQKALATETRGQNATVHFGKDEIGDLLNPPETRYGEGFNDVQKFPEQKAVVLPHEMRATKPEESEGLGLAAKPSRTPDMTVSSVMKHLTPDTREEVEYLATLSEHGNDTPINLYTVADALEQIIDREPEDALDRKQIKQARKALVSIGVFREVTDEELSRTYVTPGAKKFDFTIDGKKYKFERHIEPTDAERAELTDLNLEARTGNESPGSAPVMPAKKVARQFTKTGEMGPVTSMRPEKQLPGGGVLRPPKAAEDLSAPRFELSNGPTGPRIYVTSDAFSDLTSYRGLKGTSQTNVTLPRILVMRAIDRARTAGDHGFVQVAQAALDATKGSEKGISFNPRPGVSSPEMSRPDTSIGRQPERPRPFSEVRDTNAHEHPHGLHTKGVFKSLSESAFDSIAYDHAMLDGPASAEYAKAAEHIMDVRREPRYKVPFEVPAYLNQGADMGLTNAEALKLFDATAEEYVRQLGPEGAQEELKYARRYDFTKLPPPGENRTNIFKGVLDDLKTRAAKSRAGRGVSDIHANQERGGSGGSRRVRSDAPGAGPEGQSRSGSIPSGHDESPTEGSINADRNRPPDVRGDDDPLSSPTGDRSRSGEEVHGRESEHVSPGLRASSTDLGVRQRPSIERGLIEPEREGLTNKHREDLYKQFDELPPGTDVEAFARRGAVARFWYENSAQALHNAFGKDTTQFVKLLAAQSPQTDVRANLRMALDTWKKWNAEGRPTDEDSIAQIINSVKSSGGMKFAGRANNAIRALQDPGTELSGPKVSSFWRNLLNESLAVTNDVWMARFGGVSQEAFADIPGYLAMSAKVRKAAQALGWEPQQVQAGVWAMTKALWELGVKGKSIRDVLASVDPVNAEDVADFARLMMNDPESRGYLDDILRSKGKSIKDFDKLQAKNPPVYPRETGPRPNVSEATVKRLEAGVQQARANKGIKKLEAAKEKGQPGLDFGALPTNPDPSDTNYQKIIDTQNEALKDHPVADYIKSLTKLPKDAYRNWLNRWTDIDGVVKKAKAQGINIPSSKNPSIQVRLQFGGAGGWAEATALDQADIVKDAQKDGLYDEYIMYKNSYGAVKSINAPKNIHAKAPLGETEADIMKRLQKQEARLGPAKMAKIKALAKRSFDLNAQALDDYHAGGAISDAVYKALFARGDYQNMNRVIDKVDEVRSGQHGTTFSLRTQHGVKTLHGSELINRNPDVADVESRALIYRDLSRIRAAQSLINFGTQVDVGGLGKLMRKQKGAWDRPAGDEGTISHLNKGTPETWIIPKPLADAMTHASAHDVTMLGNAMLQAGSRLLHKSAIGYNAGFAVRNIKRDYGDTRALVGKTYNPIDAAKYIKYMGEAAYHFAKRDEAYRAYLRSGAAYSTIQKALDPYPTFQEVTEKRAKLLSHPFKLMSEFNNMVEQMSKMAGLKYLQVVRQFDPDTAAAETRENVGTPDIANAGTHGTSHNVLMPFLTTRLKGAERSILFAKRKPLKYLGLAAASLLTEYVMLRHNMSKPSPNMDGTSELSHVSENDQQNYHIWITDIPYTASDGSRRLWTPRIPRSDITGKMLGGPAKDFWRAFHGEGDLGQMALDAASNWLPGAFNLKKGDVAGSIVRGAVGSLNPFLKEPISQAVGSGGTDMYAGSPIVSQSLNERLPEDQYNAHTSPTAIGIAGGVRSVDDWVSKHITPFRVPGADSPQRVEHFIRSIVPGLGDQATSAIDAALNSKAKAEGKTYPYEGPEFLQRLPGIGPIARSFIASHIDQKQMDQEKEFYNDLADSHAATSSFDGIVVQAFEKALQDARGDGGKIDNAKVMQNLAQSEIVQRFVKKSPELAVLAAYGPKLDKISSDLSTIRDIMTVTARNDQMTKEQKKAATINGYNHYRDSLAAPRDRAAADAENPGRVYFGDIKADIDAAKAGKFSEGQLMDALNYVVSRNKTLQKKLSTEEEVEK